MKGKSPRCEELFLGWLLLGMALLAFVQVVMRYLFHAGFSWGEELSRYLCVLLTFAGAALGVEKGSHFAMDALARVLPPKAALWQTRIINLLAALIYAVVAGYGVLQVVSLQRYTSHSPALQLPMTIPYLIIPLGCGLMAWRSLKLVWRPSIPSGRVGRDASTVPGRERQS